MKKIRIAQGVCGSCEKRENFSFNGCAKECEGFLRQFGNCIRSGQFPCDGFRCMVPGAEDILESNVCKECPVFNGELQAFLGDVGTVADRNGRAPIYA